jgi:outer membrane protein assembly factor BamB
MQGSPAGENRATALGSPSGEVDSPSPDPSRLTAGGMVTYLPFIGNRTSAHSGGQDWPMAAGNPERTSWSNEQVEGNMQVAWYRPIEAYISQNTQVIASNGLLYISTARGLYALKASNGDLAWRFDSELPLGNSPTISKGVVYVGGYDRKIHALDAQSGNHLWSFDGAAAGFSTNPLVIGGEVIAGNRDGAMYAIGAHGTPNQGKLIWKYQTSGPINFSAAYKDGVLYFASNDNYAYALRADNGALVWKSEKLPGDGYQSFWPVVYQDQVVFGAALSYKSFSDPGTDSIKDSKGNGYDNFDPIQKADLFYDKNYDTGTVGPTVESDSSWAQGKQIIDGSRISEYLENNPNPDPHLHKPWRRTYIVLNRSDGSEYTYDSDQDGYLETAPIVWWGTNSGNYYPPIVGSDGIIYQNNIYSPNGQGKVMGWKIGTPYLSLVGGQGAVDEPQAISGGGNLIYRNVCCDRVADYFSINSDDRGALWTYNTPLSDQAPGYDEMWYNIQHPDNLPRIWGNYGTINGIYHNHGDQNPIIPFEGMLFTHRSNAIIAFGPEKGAGNLPLLRINPVKDTVHSPSLDDLKGRLAAEIQKIVSTGQLRPGYHNAGQFNYIYGFMSNYFENPGDTLYTLALAYPYLTPDLQQQTKAYLKSEFQTYFDPNMFARVGWSAGAAREAMPMPPEVASSMSQSTNKTGVAYGWSWQYPQNNFYAMWKYAQILPEDAGRAYELANSKLQVPVPADDNYLKEWTFETNGYITGYLGFLNLQELAGKTSEDAGLRSQVNSELNRLLELRASSFAKDTTWLADKYQNRSLNISRNFIMLVPELGDTLNKNALSKVQEAVSEYNFTAPYWFVARYDATMNEGAMQNLYDYSAMFQAKAYILKEPREELTKYLDVAAFERGDLFYIQDLVAAIEAGPH